jgi:hypothetical protein
MIPIITTTTAVGTQNESATASMNVTDIISMEIAMNDDLRTRYDAINAAIKEQREQSECGATVPIIVKSLSALSKRLDEAMGLARDAMERLEAGEKIEIRECEIEDVDIRGFFARKEK